MRNGFWSSCEQRGCEVAGPGKALTCPFKKILIAPSPNYLCQSQFFRISHSMQTSLIGDKTKNQGDPLIDWTKPGRMSYPYSDEQRRTFVANFQP
jgi:hypothetical protein